MSNLKRAASFSMKSLQETADYKPLQICKSVMLSAHPFYAGLLLDAMSIRLTDDLPTAATDGKTILINPQFFETLSVKEQVYLICHEVLHAIFMHAPRCQRHADAGFRGNKFELLIWQFACDYLVNALLDDGNVGSPINGRLINPKYTANMSVDDIYYDLWKNAPRKPRGNTTAGGEGQGGSEIDEKKFIQQQNGESFDEHLQPASYSSNDEAEWRQRVKAAVERAKMIGKLPGNMKQFIEEIANPKISWREQLRTELVIRVGQDRTSWNKPHKRRLVNPGIYWPGRVGFGAREVWVWMDTSGSIAQAEYQAFFGETGEILAACMPERLFLGFCDAQVNDVVLLEQAEDLMNWTSKIPGGGGTDFRPPWTYMLKNHAQPDVVVYLTDMYGAFPDSSPWATIWVATSEVEAPFGKTIRLDLNE